MACRDSMGMEPVVAMELNEGHRCGVRSVGNIL